MTTTFPAWVVRKDDGANTAALEQLDTSTLDDLDTTVRVRYSSINYKDALALHGRPGVVRCTPLIAGIDLTGEVIESRHPRWNTGDVVTLDGAGLGEELHGGLAGIARVNGDDLVTVPAAFTPVQAAAIGTAGFTAALALLALERHGLTPGAGPVLVTGAGGGSGSIAVALLHHSGYEVTATTGRPDRLRARLTALGATEVIDRAELESQTRPLGQQRWAGVIDSAGGSVLAGALAALRHGAPAAAFGLAGGTQLPTTVLPFILRGVALLGIDSVRTAPTLRQQAWDRLARDLDPAHLDGLTRVVPLDQAQTAAAALLEGQGTGRTVIDVTQEGRTP
ncbi:acrylyl-CoA reductase family protein [Saccharopolyspora elongata]|uniref:Acryloyl-CoA reductase n=1 Tax=Saccharopolyspora elongata TaxID=2530387 RepID=A0A4R4YA13_9PSEU|nr:acryloyl-CoA reductase [Saccharopolyspora elongata]TDD41345.1 acryloyl-CoA reductase [Saccharopolyspora elongata]